MFCPKCGVRNDDNARFCAGCGAAINGGQAPQQFQQQPQPFQQQPFQQQPFQQQYQPPRKKSKAGVVIAVILVLALLGVGAFYIFGGGLSPNHLAQVCFTTAVDAETAAPIGRDTRFPSSTPEIIVAATIRNVDKAGVYVTAVWTHTDSGEQVYSDPLYVNYDAWINFSVVNTGSGFPTGTYTVDLYVGEVLTESASFTVN
ncbi:MAG: zinc ribbon domain-containing protein [Clostridia bacterium]